MKFFGRKGRDTEAGQVTEGQEDTLLPDALPTDTEQGDAVSSETGEGIDKGAAGKPGIAARLFKRKSGPEAGAPASDDMPESAPGDKLGDDDEADRPKKGTLSRLFKRKPKGAEDDQNDSAAAGKKPGGLKALFAKKEEARSDRVAALTEGELEDIVTGELADYEFDGEQVLSIGKKKVLLGMLWDTERNGEKIRKHAAEVSEDSAEYTLYAPYRDAGQVGFAVGSRSIKPGAKAGVTAFSERRMGASWVAAFRIGEAADVWWVVAKRNGQVYEDQIFTDEDEARIAYLENLEAPDWRRRIAPEDWGLGGTDPYKIQDVIEPAIGLGLKPVNPVKAYLPRIILAVIFTLVGIGGYLYYQSYQATLQQQQEELERQREQSVRVSPSDYPWFDSPGLDLFVDSCTPRMVNAIRDVPGWPQEVISCQFEGKSKIAYIVTSWQNRGSTIPWMVAAFTPDEIQPVINADGLSAGYQDKVEFSVKTEELAEAWDQERIERVLGQRIQTMGLDISLKPTVQRVTPEQRATMKRPVFNYDEVSFATSAALDEYARLFGDVPAVVPMGLVYDLNSHSWNMTFRIYHTPIMPL